MHQKNRILFTTLFPSLALIYEVCWFSLSDVVSLNSNDLVLDVVFISTLHNNAFFIRALMCLSSYACSTPCTGGFRSGAAACLIYVFRTGSRV